MGRGISHFTFQISHLPSQILFNLAFYAKIRIVVEERDEPPFWLDYLIRINLLDVDKTREIYSEVDQLVRLYNAIKSKMKIKIG